MTIIFACSLSQIDASNYAFTQHTLVIPILGVNVHANKCPFIFCRTHTYLPLHRGNRTTPSEYSSYHIMIFSACDYDYNHQTYSVPGSVAVDSFRKLSAVHRLYSRGLQRRPKRPRSVTCGGRPRSQYSIISENMYAISGQRKHNAVWMM